MKKNIIIFGLFLLCTFLSSAQVGIGTTFPDENSILDVSSTDKGVLIPRVILDDVNTEAPLIAPLTNGMLIYSEGGLELDGFYFWSDNKWNPIGKKTKKIATTLSDGGTSSAPHTISSNVDKFETYNANWPNPLTLPNASDSNLANRFNEVIIIEKKSTLDVVISSANTDLSNDLTITNSESAIFMFDGTQWVHLKTSHTQSPQTGTYDVGSTSSGWNYYDVTFTNAYTDVPSVILNFREGSGINNGGSHSVTQVKVANASTTGFTIAIYETASTSDIFIDWIVMPRTQ